MQALILAGGRASRLYPLTLCMPKQLIMVNGYPVIHYIMEHCRNNGVEDVILCISDNPMKFDFFNAIGDGKRNGVKVSYSIGPDSLGTGGRLILASNLITDDDFVVYYGDIITLFDLREMIDFHRIRCSKVGCIATLAVCNKVRLECGVVMNHRNSQRVMDFRERPKVAEITDCKINVGIAVCNKRLLRYCRDDCDLFGDVIPSALEAGETVSSYDIRDVFYDIGTFRSLEKVAQILRQNRN